MNAFQANAQCSISNIAVTSTSCDASGTGIRICGTFDASSTSGDYEMVIDNNGIITLRSDIMISVLPAQTNGKISFCVDFPTAAAMQWENVSIQDKNNGPCSATFNPGVGITTPSPCAELPTCGLTGLNIANVCCDGSGGLRVVGSFTASNSSGNYRVDIPGIAPPFGFPNIQSINIQSAAMNGVVNFDVIIPSFNFSDVAGGIAIEDNIFGGCSSNVVSGTIPANAGACTSCTPAVATAPVPTMSQWGLLIFGLLTLNLGLIFLYKKQSQFIK